MCNAFVSGQCVHAIEPWETSWTEETRYSRHQLAQTREARRGWLDRHWEQKVTRRYKENCSASLKTRATTLLTTLLHPKLEPNNMSRLPIAHDPALGFAPPGTFWPPSLFSPGIAWSNATNGFPVAPTPPIHNPFLDARFNPIIVILVGYLKALMPGVLYNAVKSAHDQIPEFMDTLNITDALSFVVFANDLLCWTPTESFHGGDVYHILTMFYFIFDQPGLAELQTTIHPSQASQQLTWLSSWLVVYAQLIGLWMDNPLSINSGTLQTFRESRLYNVSEALEPEGS